jgi:putative component of membrane protein insertase Oxa1/YidC/SpoIIIJ protein YidD
MEALRTHGALTGTVLTVRRVLRCNPWGGLGYDPVPTPRRPLARPDGAHSSTVLRF